MLAALTVTLRYISTYIVYSVDSNGGQYIVDLTWLLTQKCSFVLESFDYQKFHMYTSAAAAAVFKFINTEG